MMQRSTAAWHRGARAKRARTGRAAGLAMAVVVTICALVPFHSAEAQEPAREPISIWRLSTYKTLTYEAAANAGDVALFALFFGGGAATVGSFLVVNVATAAAAYFTHEVAWNHFGPAVGEDNLATVATAKTLSYRVVSTSRNIALARLFGGGWAATLGFTAASNVMDAAIYAVNEVLWIRLGPPLARPGAAPN